MSNQIIEEGATFELNGVQCKVVSVGSHQVDGEPAGYSYSFRSVEDIENDEQVARDAEANREAEEAQAAADAEAARANAENTFEGTDAETAEKDSEVESENSPEGSGEKTPQENGLPLN